MTLTLSTAQIHASSLLSETSFPQFLGASSKNVPGEQVVRITDTGFEPRQLQVFGPTKVTWVNTTDRPADFHFEIWDQPSGSQSGENNVYIPLFQNLDGRMVRHSDLSYITGIPDESIVLDPGETHTVFLVEPRLYEYQIGNRVDHTGSLELKGVVVGSTSPVDGENDVAVTRDIVLVFSGALDPSTVSNDAFSLTYGNQVLSPRIHLSENGRRVSLFHTEPLPSSANVRLRIDGERLKDAAGLSVDVDRDGLPGGQRLLNFQTLSLTTVEGTSVCGRVFASELGMSVSGASLNSPLGNATITVDGQEDTLRTTTDDQGNFCLEPAPAGRFFVHVDGRTATNPTPDGGYYPFVGKAWQSIPGEQVNIGDVYLPLVPPETLQPVSEDEDVEIRMAPDVISTYPELASTTLTVPADSLFADSGERGGAVGIAPVAPDRLPGPLPEGLDFPMVITVQTDGATNFDTPVPVCFPNLPAVGSGEPLLAGEKATLWSFNHESGQFEPVGSMTATGDGSQVCSDPGVGILAPGWHGWNPFSWLGDLWDIIKQPQCWTSILIGAADCALGIWGIPGPGAWVEAASLFNESRCIVTNLYRNPAVLGTTCYVDATNSDGIPTGCLMATGTAMVKSVTSCGEGKLSRNIAGRLGRMGRFMRFAPGLSCVSGAYSAIDACFLNDQVQAAQNEITNLDHHVQIMQAYYDIFVVVFGSEKWLDFELGSGDPRVDEQLAMDLLDNIAEAAEIGSDGDVMITDGEAQQLRSLERPNGLEPADVEQLIGYWNRTHEFWSRGIVTHAEAGRMDFADAEQYGQAIARLNAALDAFTEAGFEEISVSRAFVEAAEQIPNELPLSVRQEPVFYLLKDETNGTVQRGRLSADGRIQATGIPPDSYFHFTLYLHSEKLYSSTPFFSAPAGSETIMPPIWLADIADKGDSDSDGLPDLAESVLGTDPNDADSDDDGLNDGAEISRGENPVDGQLLSTGILATVDTPGDALDVCVVDNLAAVADGEAGVSLFNVFDGMSPVLVAQLDTTGNSRNVACTTGYVAIADREGGLAIVELGDGSSVQLTVPIQLGANVEYVVARGSIVYVATANNEIFSYSLLDGVVIGQVLADDDINDLAVDGDILLVLTDEGLQTFELSGGGLMSSLRQVAIRESSAPRADGMALYTGGAQVAIGYFTGFSIFDFSSPFQPQLVGQPPETQLAMHDLAFSGAGELVGITSFAGSSTIALTLYDISDPTDVTRAISSFNLGGDGHALALHNGLALVAGGSNGLMVVNYQPADNQGVAPTVELSTNFVEGIAEADSMLYVSANAADDAQIRTVTFYIDDEPVAQDGGFPYEGVLTTPSIELGQFRLKARVVDTGGNIGWSDELLLDMVEDATAPAIRSVTPKPGAIAKADTVSQVSVTFSEALDAATLNNATFSMRNDGPDGILGTADDLSLSNGMLTFDSENNQVILDLAATLPPDHYEAIISPPLADVAGNALAKTVRWRFQLYEYMDYEMVISGNISFSTEVDHYFFVGENNRQIRFSMSAFDGNLNPFFSVIGPNGVELCDWATIGQVGQETCLLDSDGVYNLQVSSWSEDGVGPYELYIQDIYQPENVMPVPLQTITPGEISPAVDVDIYTFNGIEGEVVNIAVAKTLGDMNPFFALYRPNGTLLCERGTIGQVVQESCTLDRTGEYSIQIQSWDGIHGGSYELYLQNLEDPETILDIAYEELVSGTISPGTELDVYRFNGNEGQVVRVNASRTSGEFDPQFELYRPNGTRLCERGTTGAAAQEFCRLDTTGVYTLHLSSFQGTDSGNYELYLQNIYDEKNIEPLNLGSISSADVAPAVDVDVYRFSVEVGDQLWIHLRRTNGEIDPFFQLNRPDGTTLCDRGTTGEVAQDYCRADATGEFDLLVYSWLGTTAGSYELYVQQTNNENNALPLARGQVQTGEISPIGEVDVYTFDGLAGEDVNIMISRIDDGMDPSYVLWDPSGVELCDGGTTSSTIQKSCLLNQSGQYLLHVSSWLGGSAGRYTLLVAE